MKTIKVLMSSLMIAGLLFTTSCSKDDEGSPTGGNIQAKWNPIKTIAEIGGQDFEEPYDQNDPDCTKNYVEFKADNTVKIVAYAQPFDTCEEFIDPTPTTYEKDGNTLMISGNDDYEGTYEITKLNNSELRIRTESNSGGIETVTTIYFQKAN